MTPKRWQQVTALFHSAFEHQPAQRAAFLNDACGSDQELRREVEALIGSHENTDSFIDASAFEAAAQLLAEETTELTAGQRIGQYKIIALLGRGGMGEVYLAQDSKLGRRVALKLLPASFTRDDERVRRFEQEARAASALNHPNILTIYDTENVNGLRFIATEYVEGKTLRDHIANRKLKLSEGLDLAIQVASALEAAHHAGIVHTDIKPENIILRPDNYVKILDFGTAKLNEQKVSSLDTQAKILAHLDTEPGLLIGTPRYMSPEQVRGLEIDARTDIWSLGVVLYEMVSGNAPFSGGSTSDVIVSVLEREPLQLTRYLPEVPLELQRIITKTLRKDREERYQGVKDLFLDLNGLKQELDYRARLEHSTHSELNGGETSAVQTDTGIATQPSEVRAIDPRSVSGLTAPLSDANVKRRDDSGPSPPAGNLVWGVAPRARLPGRRLIWMASISVLVIAGGLFLYLLGHTAKSTLPPMKVVPLTSLPGTKMTPAFSSDGNQVAFAWNRTEPRVVEIYVKLVSEGEPRQLTHTGKVNFNPVWSPDGQRIAFVRSSERETAIFTISAYGEGERKLLSLDRGAERRISWSPDGKFLAFADSDKNQPSRGRAIFLLSPYTLEKRELTSPPADYSDDGPAFSPDAHALAFVRGSNSDTGSGLDLYVVPVSGGEPRRLTFGDDIFWTGPTWTEDGREIVFSSKRTGSSALWRIPVSGGNPQRLEVGSDDSIEPSIARQGHRLAYMRFPLDVNIYRIVLPGAKSPGNSPAPFLASTRRDAGAQLSPDGQRVAFESDRSGSSQEIEIWVCDIDGSNCAPVTSFGTWTRMPRWSPDGKRIVCETSRDGKTSIYTIDLETRGVRRLVADPSEERVPSWSHDGRWVYFASKRKGSWQIWKVLAEGGAPVQVTKQGGFRPLESSDSRFVYYTKGTDVAGVWRVPSDGGEEILILDQVKRSDNWEVVDDGIYFIRFDRYTHEEGAILFYDFATGRMKEIAKLGRHHIEGGGLSVLPTGAGFSTPSGNIREATSCS